MSGRTTPPATAEDLRERYIGQQFQTIEERLEAGSQRMAIIEQQLAATREELQRNSDITADIREILAAGRLGLKVLGALGQLVRWLGIVAGGLAAIYGAWHAFRQGADPIEALRQAFTKS